MPTFSYFTSMIVPGAPYVVCGAYQNDLVPWVAYGASVVGCTIALSGELRTQARFKIIGVRNFDGLGGVASTCDETTGLGDAVVAIPDTPLRGGMELRAGLTFHNRQDFPDMAPSEIFGVLSKTLLVFGYRVGDQPSSYGRLIHTGHVKAGTTFTWQPRRPAPVRTAGGDTGVVVLITNLTGPCRIDTQLLVSNQGGQLA